jgi:hypothetical protein
MIVAWYAYALDDWRRLKYEDAEAVGRAGAAYVPAAQA